MKKGLVKILALFIAVFALWGCEDTNGLTGEMDVTVGQDTFHLPVAVFYSDGATTYIAGTNINQSVTLTIKDIAIGKKTLGLSDNLLGTLSNLSNISNVDNSLIYIPISGIEEDGMTALYGEITITKVEDNSIEGNFEGGGIKTSILQSINDLSVDELQNAIVEFSGEFSAVGKGDYEENTEIGE